MLMTSSRAPGTKPTYVSSLKYSARGLVGWILSSCKLVAENTSICECTGTFSAVSKLCSSGLSPETSSLMSLRLILSSNSAKRSFGVR